MNAFELGGSHHPLIDRSEMPIPLILDLQSKSNKNNKSKQSKAEEFRKKHQGTAKGPKHILRDNRGGHKPTH
jgi:hypothetical protein